MSETIEIASVPKYVQFFHGKCIKYVATGSFHSLAITQEGDLYSWGEARSGALGTGKHRDVRKPTKIEVEGWPDIKFEQCAAGYGHSAAITTEGQLFTWGFNVYGQAGHPEKKTEWKPREVTHDIEGNELHPFIKVACSKYGTFAIDCKGVPYSWGKGYLGHGGETAVAMPKAIDTDRRIFTDIFASSDCALFYAPIRVFGIEPKCGPSKGGTQVKITGTGFLDSDKMRVRFSAGQHSQEVDCSY